MTKHGRDLFGEFLSVAEDELEFELTAFPLLTSESFLLNPRRLRGSDFLMRWSQGVWSEERVIEAVSASKDYYAVPYGPSGTAPTESVREFELYFERLDAAGLAGIKRPDILVFRRREEDDVKQIVDSLGGLSELPFHPEDEDLMAAMIDRAILAVECENSLWRAQKMPGFGQALRPMQRLGGRVGLPKGAVVPTVILKEEDRLPLRDWQNWAGTPIHLWHVFYDLAYGIPLARIEELVGEGLIQGTEQVYQAPGGATTQKLIFKIYYHYAYELGMSTEEPRLQPDVVEDANGHILRYVKLEGGALRLSDEALGVLSELAKE